MQQYKVKGRQVKAACRRDKWAYFNLVATDAGEVARKGDIKDGTKQQNNLAPYSR